MNKTDIENTIKTLQINSESVPIDYCWSGYTNNTKEFEEANFYRIIDKEHNFLICDSENAIALCDYVSNKILKLQCVWDTENIFSPGYDIWFFHAWEMMISTLDELPQWIQDIIKCLIDAGIILRCNVSEQEYFILVDSEQYLNNEFPVEFAEKIERICQKGVIEFWNECLDEVDGNTEELSEPECGIWGQKLFELFVENPEYEIMACCTSEDDHSIGFGISVPYREWLFQDDSWIFEGMSDAISENWHEFEERASLVEAQGIAYYQSNNIIPESEDSVRQIVHELLNQSLGDFTIGYEVNGISVELDYVIDVNEAVYDIIMQNFSIDFGIFNELKGKK